jgi:hypothetical protein
MSTQIRDAISRAVAIVVGRLGAFVGGKSFYNGKIAQWMRKVLGNSSKDTGWRVAEEAGRRGLSAVLFEPVVDTSQLDASFVGESAVADLASEFELYAWQGIPVLTHYYGVRHRRKSDVSQTSRRWRQLAADVTKVCDSVLLGPVSVDRDGG